ncbi:methyltransferase domain-containing protein [Seongchinamella sediminis]|uniref:Methyltransferase domain-containing protein n=1 Tax=Seongchinamella sediminis TaxID=2283635 RepID=A0A3L7DT78_9GAMM|nr:class I SAM-dependent methyltransferase [Seongchinamella sediminis]RLQ20807.1 methyltransferase domain-containing protein [Seongchinamella sediminis]
MSGDLHCPLCGRSRTGAFCRDRRREYLRCGDCGLVFVPPLYYLSSSEEKAEYDLHRNAVDDPGYRGFLSRLAAPLLARIPAAARGLDFGCGPGPALAAMLEEAGHQVALYDVFYRPDTAVLQRSYQFITATEVVEHLHRPGAVVEQLWVLLEPGGYLGIMTKLVQNAGAFARWHYKNDPTHVCFFSELSWQWWAGQHAAVLERIGADVILLRKAQ